MAHPRKLTFGAVVAIAVGVAAALVSAADCAEPARFEIDRFANPDGAPVVFIPGLGTPGEVWFETAGALDGVDAYVLSLAGFGGAPAAAPTDAFLQAAADELASWLKEAGLRGATLVGHSLGGQIALKAAASGEGRITGVLVIDSAPFLPGLRDPGADPAQMAAFEPAMRQRVANASDEAFTAMIAQGLPIQATSQEDQAQVLAWTQASDRNAFAQAMGEAMARDYRPGLAQVQVPVRVLVAHSDITPIGPDQLLVRYETQYQGLGDVQVRLIADSRHFIMLDQPAVLQAELADFLETVQ